MKIICDVTKCGYNSAKTISEREGVCECNCVILSHFCHLMGDKENVVDCENYHNGGKPFGDYVEND